MESPSRVKALIIDGFHIHISKVLGLQSFFVFYGPTGIESAACTTGITIQREVRESSDRPLFSEPNVFNIHMPPAPPSIGICNWHYSPSSLDVITQLCSASIAEDSNTGKTHHVCFGFIREMIVISAPASDPFYDIFCWKCGVSTLCARQGKMPRVSWDIQPDYNDWWMDLQGR